MYIVLLNEKISTHLDILKKMTKRDVLLETLLLGKNFGFNVSTAKMVTTVHS